mgnify:CR=1 FL=1
MSDVKWIKIYTDMFNNRKIKQLRKLPEGDALIGVWVQILCLAGQINDNGMVYFSKDIPFTEEMLATEFDRPINIIKIALATYQKFKMIDIIDDILLVSNWQKYQNTDKLEEIKKQNRIRQARFKEKQKKITEGNVKVTLPITLGNATDKDIKRDIDVDIDKEVNTDINKKEDINNKEYCALLPQCTPSLDDKLSLSAQIKKSIDNAFTVFWDYQVKKVHKEKARKAWDKVFKSCKTLDDVKKKTKELSPGMKLYKKLWQTMKDMGEYSFIPHPATWLNGKQWLDDPESINKEIAEKEQKRDKKKESEDDGLTPFYGEDL